MADSPDSPPHAPHQMWGGRFATPPADALRRLNDSLPVDRRLWRQDVSAGETWAGALHRAGLLDSAELTKMVDGLRRVGARLAAGDAADAGDEDVHTLVERLLYEEIGPLAGKLHTGRSRNDQVATDVRLWCLESLGALDAQIRDLLRALAGQARDGLDLVMPGYTHGQQAQVVRWGFVLLAHAWPLVRDLDRLADAARRTAVLPLGSGALAGTGFTIDRAWLCEQLGFASVGANALDATGDRDFVADVLYAMAMIAVHLSRLGAELVLYSSAEYGFVRLDDAFATGSSLMPQKRNPDVFELARGKAARTLGDLVALVSAVQGLPAGYSKDLQDDKVALFDAADTVSLTLAAVTGAVRTLRPVPERMEEAITPAVLSTDLADGLVLRGVPFREAHSLAGQLVRAAEEEGVPLTALSGTAAAAVHPAFPELLQGLGSYADSTDRRSVEGGTGRSAVEAQLARLETLLGD